MTSTGQDFHHRLTHPDTDHVAIRIGADRYVLSFWAFEEGAMPVTGQQAVAALDLAGMAARFEADLFFDRTPQTYEVWNHINRLAAIVGLEPYDAALRALQPVRSAVGGAR